MSQSERILYLDKKMRSGGCRVTAEEAANHFEVSTRQVKRDIEYMRNRLNAPVIYDSSIRAYCYESEYNDLKFANQDFVLSFLALQSFVQNKQYFPLYEDSLLSQLDEQVPQDYREVCKNITYQMPPVDAIKPDFFEDICTSMRDSKCLDMKYVNLRDEVSQRTIEVQKLINYGGNWYVIAWDKMREDLRTFNVSRIQSLSLTKEKFASHGNGFDKQVAEFLAGGFGIFHGSKTTPVTIHFYGKASRIVSTQEWHPEQKMSQVTDEEGQDCLELKIPVADFTELLGKVLAFGRYAVPVSPKEFVDLWKDEVKAISSMM